ncbi:hypothetical protein A3SI_18532 [Nitritalea halalkaliphila LW7]|uniref:Uncharacterized protein n=1 Tax=Nitritalea halalkaliphila LW7 TaxID=1189621 RepID=I5BU48_9BACT|nr:hypothetical protein A3SI_18532 [Nitritalea halalkaliphila LW7]
MSNFEALLLKLRGCFFEAFSTNFVKFLLHAAAPFPFAASFALLLFGADKLVASASSIAGKLGVSPLSLA